MTTSPQIILNNISLHLEQTPVQFTDINLTFQSLKYGIVGPNGIGKTTFLQLLTGQRAPDRGSLMTCGSVIDIPQSHITIANQASIGDALGVSQILQAQDRISNGSIEPIDFDTVADNWDIARRMQQALATFNLWPINIKAPFNHLSGGQKTKVLLAKTLIFAADFMIFDEPTNNLDRQSRDILYQYIKNSRQGLIIVSHDRELLNICDRIIELNTKGIDVYGGNYDFYREQKAIKQQSLEQEVQARREALIKSKQTIQTRLERHQQNEARGHQEKAKQIKGTGSYNKIELKSKKGKSESTNRRIRLQADRKLEAVNHELLAARKQLEVKEELNIELAQTKVANNKTVINLDNICFGYSQGKSIINNFSLHLAGPKRAAITGPNGCGKSTLIKLIRGLIRPDSGEITIGVRTISYLDQTVSFLDESLSILDNFLRLNPKAKPFDAYCALAAFKFRNKQAEQCVGQLSGGERMRAGLAVSLMSTPAPELIILDEPTNHLDLDTIEAIEEALALHQGAILAVSHDQGFLKNIKIGEFIKIGART